MIGTSVAFAHDDPLVPISARFSLSRAGLPVSDEPQSGPTNRPFALRFVRELSPAVSPPLPSHRYCPQRQILITDDAAARPVYGATMTTIGTGSRTSRSRTRRDDSGPHRGVRPYGRSGRGGVGPA